MLEIFPYMNNICFDNIENFADNVDQKRKDMLSADKELLCSKATVIDIDHISGLPNGKISSFYKGYQFDSFFYRKEGSFLYVILNGALTGEKPQFNRWSYYSFLEGGILDIADPMYERYDGLELGWYYGTDEENLRVYLAEYVQKIACYLGIESKNIVFFGSSGGGAAVLECTNYIEGAIGVAINPQIMLLDWGYSYMFEKITKNNLSADPYQRTDGIYQLAKGRHILLINLRSNSDMIQLEKVCKAFKIEVQYGINYFKNLIIWIYDCDMKQYIDAHNLQENYCVFFLIEWLVRHFDDEWELEDKKSLIRLVNEFWSYRYRLELDWRNQNKRIRYIHTARKIAVWGTGEIGRNVLGDILNAKNEGCFQVDMCIDSNKSLEGTTFYGIKVIMPDSVKKWEMLLVIIAVENGKNEVVDFLNNRGMQYKSDYILYNDIYC